MNAPLILNAACTWALVGLIWTVQVVHYPLFDGVGTEGFARWHRRHAARITGLVGVLMPVEALTAAWLVLAPPPGTERAWLALGLALVAVAWLATAVLAVPCHRRLSRGFDAAALRRLLRANAWRTAAWTARGVLVAGILLALGRP